jgi:hypothetical protein
MGKNGIPWDHEWAPKKWFHGISGINGGELVSVLIAVGDFHLLSLRPPSQEKVQLA